MCTVLVDCVLFSLIGRNFKDVLFIGFLCSTNEHNIPIDLNRFQVVSRVVKKVEENVVHIAETNYHIKVTVVVSLIGEIGDKRSSVNATYVSHSLDHF